MAWTKEEKQKRRAEAITKRATEDAARKIIRKPRGRQPAGKDWDEHSGRWIDRPPALTDTSQETAHATADCAPAATAHAPGSISGTAASDDAPASTFPGLRHACLAL